jgi:spermidine synthase
VAWFFAFFFVSGFCSILYELVWLRLSMAQFGVTTALVSIVLSAFMGGLGLGSWVSGSLLRKRKLNRAPALRTYALIELLIGVSALLVPLELQLGRHLLHSLAVSSSFAYYIASGAWLAIALVPWCACMGATIPVGMQAMGCEFQKESPRAFSFLYLANVLGAVAGATLPLLLIEFYGFHGALRVGAVLNGGLAFSAGSLSLRATAQLSPAGVAATLPDSLSLTSPKLLILLFTTGLTSMGMEVVWIRQFTPYLTTVVYAFAVILGVYLLFTFVGSRIYRRWSARARNEPEVVWSVLGVSALLPLVAASPKIHFPPALRAICGIAPFSAFLGFVTPMLVDRWSRGNPHRAGTAYAVNIVGCILGPLLAGFVLLPVLSERWALVVLALPWLAIGVYPGWSLDRARPATKRARSRSYAFSIVAIALVLLGRDYESRFHHREILRDHTATIIAAGEGMRKQLFVNGIGITVLTPATKMMAHLPLAFLNHPPQNALAICFGMGTSFRSLLSWNIPVTAVELVPSVPRLFWYFHPDAPALLASPLAHVVIDDGRRYLERTPEQYDVITIDPPPPVEAAGSSLLYTKEFYATLKPRLRAGGILQQWLPHGDQVDDAAIAGALKQSFPYIRAFWENPQDRWGIHFLASMQPLHNWTAPDLAAHMPATAAKDLIEWGPQSTAERQFAAVMANEASLDAWIREAPHVAALQDDKPVNEYYLARRRILPALKQYF